LIAEESTVGGLMIDASRWPEVKQIISIEDFHSGRVKAIFKAISKQLDNGQPANVVTMCDTKGLDLGYVASLAKNTPSAANISAYAKEVKKHSDRRKLLAALKKTANLLENGSKTTEEAFDFLLSVESQIHSKNIASFKLIPATALTTQPTVIKYLVKGYIPEKSIIEIFGAPGSGKSFVAMDWAFCIANGIDWHEKGTSQGTVVYIAGEGFAGIGQRLRALEVKHGMPANNLIISKQPASLTDEQNAQWVADAIHQHNPVMIVIDTLSRNFGGGDENSTRDMNAFISNLDLYIKGDATVVLVHHSGHSEKSRARGSSVLNGAVDVEYCINKNENIVTMSN
ncbi:MAG: AAA family ATPase, partial [Thiotrichaceae bacterium]|nr:AAA family ATPase [Thiotrichaceae bacterium]